ncbi:MAG: hypothetical protein JW873_06190 [Candidatus Saganbacteria bacterium]|nr:hypothetical protein [Candidatus Saganbacteria bacterium]
MILIALVIGAGLAAAAQEPPVYPNAYWVLGTLAKGPAPDASGYQVTVYKVAGNSSAAYASGVTGSNGQFAVNPFDDQRFSPQPGTDYYIAVAAKTAADGKVYSVDETKINFAGSNQGYYVVNLTLSAVTAVPGVPGGLVAAPLTPSSERLSWNLISDATSYLVSLGTDPAGTNLGTVTTTEPAYDWTGLGANALYYWSVKAVNAAGASAASETASFTTMPLAGTVPLDITSSGGDLVLTWNNTAYPSVDIYRLVSDDTKQRGQYSRNYPGTDKGSAKGWELVSPNNTTGQYSDTGYIAAGPKEAYYKALNSGQAPAANIPAAPAYGKYDLELTAGFNLASTPLVPLHGSAIDNVFINPSGGGLRSDQEQVYYFNESSLLTVKALYDAAKKTWLYLPNSPFTITPGNGYWIYEKAAANRVSVLGAVISAASHRSLGINFSLIGSPLPTFNLDLSAAGLPPAGLNEIYYYHNGLQEKMINKNNVWINVVPGAAAFGFYPGAGYWYRNTSGAAIDWTLNP